MQKSDIFWQTYLNLEKEAIELSKYIFFTDEIQINSNGNIVSQSYNSQLETFSPYIADLLVRCCVQIEAISKELYLSNGGTKSRGDKELYFDEDCLKLIDIKWETHNKTVMVVAPFFNFTKDENHILKPLKEAHKRGGTYWERAYQAVKHDRYLSLPKGNIKAFLHALAALYLLNLYYRNDSWTTKYQDIQNLDYSIGSAIFAVKPPIAGQLWNGNKPTTSESPYVVNYQDKDYQQIIDMKYNDRKATINYLNNQPELHETAFINQLKEDGENTSLVNELTKYRLNKKFPNNLPFGNRKNLLINSLEWKKWIHENEDYLTEENIQQTIDKIANLMGVEIMVQYEASSFLPFALNGAICKIHIP